MKKLYLLLLILVLSCLTFAKMLRPGIYSMQDFHYFRLIEFTKCMQDLQIPCRWSSEAGLGYGEPIFNFYGQLPYVLGSAVHFLGASYVDSLKLSFIFSFVVSAVGMYLLSKKIWKSDIAGVLSAILYLYAPYRSVDVWVRGALPEAMSFAVLPFIFLFFENFLENKSKKNLSLFSLSLAFLINTHNLSVVMAMPLLIIWIVYRIWQTKKIKLVPQIAIASLFALLLSAFYLLPVIFESKYVDINSTTRGYFNFRGHFAEIHQLLISQKWGYGGSVFGNEDGLSLAIGIVQWVLPIILLFIVLFRRKLREAQFFSILLLTGWFYLFLTHNKSTFIWESLSFLKYLQFPWRFLGMALFCFSLAGGYFSHLFTKNKKIIFFSLLTITILLNYSYFREDIWYDTSDIELTSGEQWINQTRASISDYWPANKAIPSEYSPSKTYEYELVDKKSNKLVYKNLVDYDGVNYPVNDFPGFIKNTSNGYTTFEFKNTTIRTIGNIVTLLAILVLSIFNFAK